MRAFGLETPALRAWLTPKTVQRDGLLDSVQRFFVPPLFTTCQVQVPCTAGYKELEHGRRMLDAGVASFLGLVLEDCHVPAFWLLLHVLSDVPAGASNIGMLGVKRVHCFQGGSNSLLQGYQQRAVLLRAYMVPL